MIRILILFFTLTLALSCSSSKKSIQAPVAVQDAESVIDSALITEETVSEVKPIRIERPAYASVFRETPERRWDLIHTALELSFDWEKQRVNGKARLTLVPYAYPDSVLVLDAKNFDIHSVMLFKNNQTLVYSYDSLTIQLILPRQYQRQDTLSLQIEYTAKPAERKWSEMDGAVSSDQGLFFINPMGKTKDKPRQIWTQGETSYNSCWFPTIDHPNERCTGEITVTVENSLSTLSNGLLKQSTDLGKGMRRDHWVMDQPHAPYLFMLAIGEFAVVKETWRGKELGYWVEPEYAPFARDIFAHTPEMLSFFSEKFGLEYPWQKYHQVVVRDYVSGAMENTTAVIFGDFVQKTRRQLLQDNNDRIVAHEMAHHWFGNYVTCESWANLTMNEGFANYAEYLWLEHKYGRDEADLHRAQELSAYLEQTAEGDTKNLIRFDYEQEEDMFDAHSYNKGGLVLHMLRQQLGDEVFFEGVRRFLKKHAREAVEAHQLRLVMEEVSGRDLQVFFDQWYFDKGHPHLEVRYIYEEESKKMQVFIQQSQPLEQHRPLFDLSTELAVFFSDGRMARVPVRIKDQTTVISVDVPATPAGVLLDPDYTLLAKIEHQFDPEAAYLMKRFEQPLSAFYRLETLNYFENMEVEEVFYQKALKDPFWMIRGIAAERLTASENKEKLWSMALSDPHAFVRTQALNTLVQQGAFSAEDQDLALQILKKGDAESGDICGLALGVLNQLDAPFARNFVMESFEAEKDPAFLLSMIAVIQSESMDIPLGKIADKAMHFQGYEIFNYLSYFFMLSETFDTETVDASLDAMTEFMAFGDSRPIQRYGFMTLLANILGDRERQLKEGELADLASHQAAYERAVRWFEQIRSVETNSQLKAAYEYMR
jgi:aminopeptidase N